MELDILDDAAMRLSAIAPVEAVRQVIGELRRDWGGDRPFIRAMDRAGRNDKIRAGLAAGQPVKVVARAVGCGESTVYRYRQEWGL